ncbi:MAG: hypothetical protein QXS02_05580 [Candidatus Thermoplasmatota archaeon]
MMKKDSRIWIWKDDAGLLLKAVLSESDRTLSLYDEDDNLIFIVKGLTAEEIKSFISLLSVIGAKRIDNKKEPFVYL